MSDIKLLLIDDDEAVRKPIALFLKKRGFEVMEAENGKTGIERYKKIKPDLILVDLRMPEIDGMDVISFVCSQPEHKPVIVVSGTGDLTDAIEAVRRGAWDYILKPVTDFNLILYRITKALERQKLLEENKAYQEDLEEMVEQRTAELNDAYQELSALNTELERLKNRLQDENIYLQEEIKLVHNFEEIIGESPAIKSILKEVELVAPSDTSVLILGETGTGKELIARAVHNLSNRQDRPLVKVNCAALPSTLIESELFGHEKGAFTGATNKRIGRFELADKGTIFLDEISELPLDLQSKLLRVLQEGELERVGGEDTIKVDVRVIAATNRDLKQAIKQNTFREDLYYRLNVIPIHLPPLRERKEDIPLLAMYFAKKYGKKIGKDFQAIAASTLERLKNIELPGNIRELENIIERAVIFSKTPTLSIESGVAHPGKSPYTPRDGQTLEEMERNYILHILNKTKWRIEGTSGAAEILNLHPNTLRSRIKKLKISKPAQVN